jgi:hypothetical protein
MTIFNHARRNAGAKLLAAALATLVLAAGCGASKSVSRSGVSASASGSAATTGATGSANGGISQGAVNRIEQAVASRLVRDIHVSGDTLVLDMRLPEGSLTQGVAGAACSQVRDSGLLSAGKSLGVTHVRIVGSNGGVLAQC